MRRNKKIAIAVIATLTAGLAPAVLAYCLTGVRWPDGSRQDVDTPVDRTVTVKRAK